MSMMKAVSNPSDSRRGGRPLRLFPLVAAGILVVAGATSADAQRSTAPSPMVETCLFDGEVLAPTNDVSIQGRVLDQRHDVPVAGARVDATWIEEDGEERMEEAWTDHDGFFRFCRIEDGLTVRLSPEVGGGPGPTARTTSGLDAPVLLLAPLPEPEAASGLFGVLREVQSGRPVTNAIVRIPTLDLEARSVSDGSFIFQDVPTGSYDIEIDHPAYGTLDDEVHLVAGRPLEMTFNLNPDPIVIQGVRATARPRDWLSTRGDITRRLQQNMGNYLNREDFLRFNEPPLHQMLTSVPGFRAEYVTRPGGRRVYYPEVGGCGVPAVYVDDALIVIDPDMGLGIDSYDTRNIEMIEFYRGTATLPAQYQTGRSRCGLMLIWTQRGP